MKNTLLALALLFFFSCKTNTYLVNIEETSVKMEAATIEPDESIHELIAPYKQELDATMSEVIGQAAQTMPKGRPESLLGNWSADAIHKKTADYYGQPIDFAFTNDGGLRIPAMNEGNITVGNIFELMPFDNMLVVLELDYETVMQLFQFFAKKNEHLSYPVKLIIKNETLQSATLNGQPLDKHKIYKVATTDYLANGGGNLTFLKNKTRVKLEKYMRDALIEFVKEETQANRKINSKLEGRVIIE